MGTSPAQLAWLESNHRGPYVEDFVRIAEALGENPGNLLPNDRIIGHLKPLIDRVAAVGPEFLARMRSIVEKVALLTEDVTEAARLLPLASVAGRRTSKPTGKRKRRQ